MNTPNNYNNNLLMNNLYNLNKLNNDMNNQ